MAMVPMSRRKQAEADGGIFIRVQHLLTQYLRLYLAIWEIMYTFAAGF